MSSWAYSSLVFFCLILESLMLWPYYYIILDSSAGRSALGWLRCKQKRAKKWVQTKSSKIRGPRVAELLHICLGWQNPMGSKNCLCIYHRPVASGGAGGVTRPPHFLTDQLTLSQPGEAHYTHPVLCSPVFSDLATALYHDCPKKFWTK